MPDLTPYDDFLSAGYLLIRTAAMPEGIGNRPLLTQKVISVCECLYPRFPGTYAIDWCAHSDEERDEEFEAMGVAEESREEAMDWATESFDVEHGAWGIFFRLEDARDARNRFLKQSKKVRLIGLGVHKDDVTGYLKTNQPPKPEPGFAPEGMMGQTRALSAHNPMEPGGKLLGFELITTYMRMMDCSWLCNGLETELAEKLGIRPNEFGLIPNYEEARRGADLINSDIGAEPGTWMPWGLVEYAF